MENVLVIRFTALGDLVTLEPMFRALRHFHPDAHITCATSAIGQQLYQDTDYFNKFIIPETNENVLSQSSSLAKQSGKTRYDYIYNLQSNSLSHLLILRLHRERIVYRSSAPWQKLLGIKPRGKTPSQVLASAGFPQHLIDAYFAQKENNLIRLAISQTLCDEYQSQLHEHFGDRPIVVLAPGASVRWVSKKWGDERYARLAAQLEKNGVGVIIVGSNLERDAANTILKTAPNSIDFTGRTSIRELKALLSCSNVMIGNDSGPAHLAAGTGISTITIFAPTSTVHCVANLDYSGHHYYLSPESVDCKTCYDPACSNAEKCMSGINMDRILTIVSQLIPANNE